MESLLPELFSSYLDVHTFELGVLLGLFVALTYRTHEPVAYLLLFFGVFLAFGNGSHIGWGGISRKPWYFLGGLYVTTTVSIVAPLVSARVKARLARSEASNPRPSD